MMINESFSIINKKRKKTTHTLSASWQESRRDFWVQAKEQVDAPPDRSVCGTP